LVLNIDMDKNALDYNVAKNVGIYFRLNETQMNTIIEQVLSAISCWKEEAIKLGIVNKEIQLKQKVFNF